MMTIVKGSQIVQMPNTKHGSNSYPHPLPSYPGEGTQANRVIGNVRLIRKVGDGGFGAVYEARHVTLGNTFAVKLLKPELSREEKFYERFQREAYLMAELRHENVVQIFDFGVEPVMGPYLISEWLEGQNLFRLWRAHHNLKWGWIYALFSQLLDALQYTHDRGIIHRDLKPENMILTTGSRSRLLLKIVDFGIARMVVDHVQQAVGHKRVTTMNRHGVAIGTPFYMAPEQVRGEIDKIDHRTDLYACGILLAELLTGQRVFQGENLRDTMRLQIEALPPTLHELNPQCRYPRSLEMLVAKALAKDPAQRFQSALAFYHDLEESMSSAGIVPIWEDIYKREPGRSMTLLPEPERRMHRYKELKPGGVFSSFWTSAALGVGVACLLLLSCLVGLVWWKPNLLPRLPVLAMFRSQLQRQPVEERKDNEIQSSSSKKMVQLSRPAPPRESARKRVPFRQKPTMRTRARHQGTRVGQRHRAKRNAVDPLRVLSVRKRVLKQRPSVQGSTPKWRAKTNRSRNKSATRAPVKGRARHVNRSRPAEQTHALLLITIPPEASVWYKGQRLGSTPFTLREKQGRTLSITLKKEGYLKKVLRWNMKKDDKKIIRLIEDLFN